ncbi:MAG: lycopene cyclase family protein [Planctomycetota bacterium]
MSERADIVVLGGGCAGLSLAAQLASRERDGRRVLVLEAREDYERDRTWCGWSIEPHTFQDCVDHRWSQWDVRANGVVSRHASSRFPYEHVPADLFYAAAQERIEAADGVDLLLGTRVESVTSRGDRTRVATSRGEIDAGVVVDARAPSPTPGEGGLLQHFLGLEITTRDAVFDPSTVTLMDFDVPQESGIQFLYVLPFAPDRALVESTFLSPTPLPQEDYVAQVERYVDERLETETTEVHHREAGVIPMNPQLSGADNSVRIGTLGGAVKPSSGYAFHSIQRTTATLADALVSGRGVGSVPARSGLDAWMDRVFLSFLSRRPEGVPAMFLRLFRSVDADVLARFLMERGRASDRLRVIGAMPKLPFAREAMRVALP